MNFAPEHTKVSRRSAVFRAVTPYVEPAEPELTEFVPAGPDESNFLACYTLYLESMFNRNRGTDAMIPLPQLNTRVGDQCNDYTDSEWLSK